MDANELNDEQLAAMPFDDAVEAVMLGDGVGRELAEEIVALAVEGGDVQEI